MTTTSAHPGKTDAQGGHYDRSTGEYHFHHGYPAHQHENGVCPYNNIDKTDHSNHGSSGSKHSSPLPEATTEKKPVEKHSYAEKTPATSTKTKKTEQKPALLQSAIWPLLVLSSSIMPITYLIVRIKEREVITKEQEQKQSVITEQHKRLDPLVEKLQLLQAEYLVELRDTEMPYFSDLNNRFKKIRSVYRENSCKDKVNYAYAKYYLCSGSDLITNVPPEEYVLNQSICQKLLSDVDLQNIIQGIPSDVNLNNDGNLSFPNATDNLPYGKYTAYKTAHGKKIHRTPFCPQGQTSTVCLLNYKPNDLCHTCFKNPPDTSWYQEFSVLAKLKTLYKNEYQPGGEPSCCDENEDKKEIEPAGLNGSIGLI